MNADPAPPPIPRTKPLNRIKREDVHPNLLHCSDCRKKPLDRIKARRVILRANVLSALAPEMRSHPDVIKSFRNRAEHLKGKIILIANRSLLFTEDTFWEFADALLVKKDTNLATQKATQWVKTGGAVLTDEHKYSEGLVKSVDGPFYRFICVESTFHGSKTNFWLSIDNVSRRSPSDFALAINQYQKPFESETEHIVSARVGDAFWCVYHFSDGGLNGDEISTSGYDVGITPENVGQPDQSAPPSESSPASGESKRNIAKIDVKKLVDDLKGVTTSTEEMNSEETQQSTDETSQPTEQTKVLPVTEFHQEFKLGGYSYKVDDVRISGGTGNPGFLYREKPSPGATYIFVNYRIRNDGGMTTETDNNDLMLLDAQGHLYAADVRATGAIPSHLNPRQLHPGIFSNVLTIFEVPRSVAESRFTIIVPEKNVDEKGRRLAKVVVTYDAPSPTPTPKPDTKRPNRSGRGGKAGAGEKIYPSEPLSAAKPEAPLSSDWRMTRLMRNGRYELVPVYYGVYRRKEQIGLEQEERGEDNITPEQRELERRMSRPPGVPWRNFSAPDEHGYPNN